MQWNKTLGGNVNDIPTSIEQTTDGGYIVAGWSLSPVSGDKTESNKGGVDVWLVKLDGRGIYNGTKR